MNRNSFLNNLKPFISQKGCPCQELLSAIGWAELCSIKTPMPPLTSREQEIGLYLVAGLTGKQISKRLKISFHTVEGYQRDLKKKLKSKTPCQMGYLLGKLELKQNLSREE